MPRRDGGGPVVIYRSDFDKHVIISNCERRGWLRTSEDDDDYNFCWASVHTIRQLFNPESGQRLSEHQIVNHFPNHYELTRKDLMVKNIKRYRREREKQELLQQELGQSEGAPCSGTGGAMGSSGGLGTSTEQRTIDSALGELPAEWVPTTFVLPNDYSLFVEEFRKNPNTTWIAKPTGKAQGRGIFLVSKLQQLKRWSNAASKAPFSQSSSPFSEPYIISRYIADPLLVGGKKFDMRLYVLVTSFRPLKVYLYKSGFCRFCVEQYSSDVAEIDNIFVHLTNVAIQKQAEDYNSRHGGKWDMEDLMLFIESTRGKLACDRLRANMDSIIVHSLKAVQSAMINDKHCFELYGFDILIDSSLRPWLLEINASPSLTATTEEDRLLKLRLINDTFNIVTPPNLGEMDGRRISAAWCEEPVVGGFDCIYDEGRVGGPRGATAGGGTGGGPPMGGQRPEETRRSQAREPRRSGTGSSVGGGGGTAAGFGSTARRPGGWR